jgi:hypothetical protein
MSPEVEGALWGAGGALGGLLAGGLATVWWVDRRARGVVRPAQRVQERPNTPHPHPSGAPDGDR